MKTYTEQELKEETLNAMISIMREYSYQNDATIQFHSRWFKKFDEKEVEEDKISFTYSFLRRKLDWTDFCELTGTNEWAKKEGREFKDDEIFYIIESKAKQFNLI